MMGSSCRSACVPSLGKLRSSRRSRHSFVPGMNSQRKDPSTCADGAAPGTNGGRSRRVRRCRFGTTLSQNSTSWHRPLLLIAAVLLLGCDVEGFSDTRPSKTGGLKMPSSASSAISAGPRCFSSSARLLPAHSMLFASSSTTTTDTCSPRSRFTRIVATVQRLQSSLRQHTQPVRRLLAIVLLATALFFGGSADPALAGGRSGGRAGGSFGRSSYRPPPISRPMHRPGGSRSPMLHPGMYRRHPAIYFMPRPGYYNNRGDLGGSGAAVSDAPTSSAGSESGEVIEMTDLVATTNERTSPNAMSSSRRGTKVVDPITYYAALTGVYGMIVYKANRSKNASGDVSNGSALGPGVSVGRLTVSLDISDRDDPNNALARIGDIAKKANIRSRKGVQSLVADVSLELLRQEAAVSAACSSYSHLKSEGAAERTYYQLSTVERSKFDRESINKFGGKNGLEEIIDDADNVGRVSGEPPQNKATSAVVTLIFQIEGDQTKIPNLTSRSDLKNALLRIAADAQTEEALLGAEVLWTPERRGDSITEQEVASLYPELRIL